MSRRLSEILVHQDWEEKYGRIKYSYNQPVTTPFVTGDRSGLVPAPDQLLEAEEIVHPLFNDAGYCNTVADIGRNGVYLLYLRPHHRLTKIIVTPDDVVVDLFLAEDERLVYSFFNPTSRAAITVTAQIVEDIEGVFRKISTATDDLTWRQYFVRRAMAKYDMPEWASPDIALPEIMTARQVAHYLDLEVKTIQNWTSKGLIPFNKAGGSPRYLKSEIDKALTSGALGNRSAATGPKKRPKRPLTPALIDSILVCQQWHNDILVSKKCPFIGENEGTAGKCGESRRSEALIETTNFCFPVNPENSLHAEKESLALRYTSQGE